MTSKAGSRSRTIDIEGLSFEQGAHLLIKRALSEIDIGEKLGVRASAPEFAIHLRSWCRSQGHDIVLGDVDSENGPDQNGSGSPFVGWITRGKAASGRWTNAHKVEAPDPSINGSIVEHPPAKWGLAARGSTVEDGAPEFHFGLTTKAAVWADNVPRLYAQALAAQWDPAKAIDWEPTFTLPDEIETAVVQVMTYLIENETAALLVPARFLAQIHPHFREVMQLLAIQLADEARHVEVFTRRATLFRKELGLSTASAQASLKTLFDEPDFTLASFLLSVLGEGTFLNLLWFLQDHAPDPIPRQITRLAAPDEARHVAFGMGHVEYQIAIDPTIRERMSAAIHRRYDLLSNHASLNEEVFDSLVILAAGEWTPAAIATGFAKVQKLKEDMAAGRKGRLLKLGF